MLMKNYTQRLEKIEAVLCKKLPEKYEEIWLKSVFGDLPQAVNQNHISPLITPCRELLVLGGKRWRPLFLVLCSELFTKDVENAYDVVPIVEFVHTASLIHDDIEDCADMRRGKPSAYITHGLDTALNSGSWLYFNAYETIDSLNVSSEMKLKLYQTLSCELRRLHLGQAMDISWHRNNSVVPTQAEYESMVRMKTGTLSCLSAKVGALIGGASDNDIDFLGKIAADIGVGFQVLDDVTNLKTGNPGKKRGDDIVEGKKSLPVLIHLQENKKDFDFFEKCFTQARLEGIDSPAVEKCILRLTESGAVDKALCYAENLVKSVCFQITSRYDSESAQLIADLFLKMFKK